MTLSDTLPAKAAENLDRWAELTALAIELRKSVLALESGEADIEHAVWTEMREAKEKAWTNSAS
jgi:hypothetical protein